MLQAIIKKGKVFPENVPNPILSKGEVLIDVTYSCISAGTELKSVGTSGENLLVRAKKQPENLKKVINLAKTQGIKSAFSKVKQKVKYGTPIGYSNAGVIIAIGEGVKQYKVGDRVAAAGAGIANHAELVVVPENLVMPVPEKLSLKLASTVTLGGISLQAVRRADLKLGEYALIIGAGILGLLTLQFLKNSGIRVIVSDIDSTRLDIAKKIGADKVINPMEENILNEVNIFTGGHGVDAVIFTAATESNEPLSDAFKATKKKGSVILVGVSGMGIKREDIYKKELDFKISTSYGPGRYDRSYEEQGKDYPYAYVRWTENRNMTEYLKMLDEEKVKLDLLISKTYHIKDVEKAYKSLQEDKKSLIVLLKYNDEDDTQNASKIIVNNNFNNKKALKVALVGAGSFATAMHLPNMMKMKNKFVLYAVVNRTGHKAKSVASHFGAKYATSDINDVLQDPEVDVVFITTQHKDHAKLVLRSLQAGKHTFVEKPLATTLKDLENINKFYLDDNIKVKPILLTGYNRRFSKYAKEIFNYTSHRQNPLFISYRINAGYKNPNDAIHDHGGRVIGELCHFIDLISYLTQSKIKSISVDKLTPNNEHLISDDNIGVILKYNDGSIANIQYFANGNKEYAKESMEFHFDGKTIVLNDFKQLKGYGLKINEIKTKNPEKGQYEELLAFHNALRNDEWPISLQSMIETTNATFAIQNE